MFIDPHGLEHEGPGSDKMALASEIKKLEQRLKDPTVTLESAILSPGNNRMKVEHLWTMRGQARPNLTALHVYFMAEAGYLDAVVGLATA